MPAFHRSLTLVTVIVSTECQTATIKDAGNETIRIIELTEAESIKLIEKLQPVVRHNVDGDWFKYTLESIPDVGNSEDTKGDWG